MGETDRGKGRGLQGREVAVLLPLILCIVWVGIYPRPLLKRVETSVEQVLARAVVGENAAEVPQSDLEPDDSGPLAEGN